MIPRRLGSETLKSLVRPGSETPWSGGHQSGVTPLAQQDPGSDTLRSTNTFAPWEHEFTRMGWRPKETSEAYGLLRVQLLMGVVVGGDAGLQRR